MAITGHNIASARRAARSRAIVSYAKGEADCRDLSAGYLEKATQAGVQASTFAPGSEEWNERMANVAYYRKMSEDATRIANSNAEMVRMLGAAP